MTLATDATKCILTFSLFILYYGCMKAYLNAAEVAKLLSVDRATVTRWIKRGVIKDAIRPGGTQNWRIPLSSYQELSKQYESR